jgi:hypothetical protein
MVMSQLEGDRAHTKPSSNLGSTQPVVSMVGGLDGVTLLHSIGRSRVEERFYSNSVEWSGVISGYSMELYGIPKGDAAKPNEA